VDGDLARQVAARDRGGHVGDVAHLAGEVGGHRVHVVREVLPGAADPGDLRLSAELALGTDLAGDARDLGGEAVELVDHRVDGVLQLEDLALHVDGDLLGQVAAGHRSGNLGDVADLAGQVRRHRVHIVRQVLPGPGDSPDLGLRAHLAPDADLAGDARHLRGEGRELVDHRVDGVLQLLDLALDVDSDLLRQVAAGDGGRHVGDVTDLTGQVRGHGVDVVGQVLPGPGDSPDLGLAAQLALGADLTGNARHLRGEGRELVDHGVDDALDLEDLALCVDG